MSKNRETNNSDFVENAGDRVTSSYRFVNGELVCDDLEGIRDEDQAPPGSLRRLSIRPEVISAMIHGDALEDANENGANPVSLGFTEIDKTTGKIDQLGSCRRSRSGTELDVIYMRGANGTVYMASVGSEIPENPGEDDYPTQDFALGAYSLEGTTVGFLNSSRYGDGNAKKACIAFNNCMEGARNIATFRRPNLDGLGNSLMFYITKKENSLECLLEELANTGNFVVYSIKQKNDTETLEFDIKELQFFGLTGLKLEQLDCVLILDRTLARAIVEDINFNLDGNGISSEKEISEFMKFIIRDGGLGVIDKNKFKEAVEMVCQNRKSAFGKTINAAAVLIQNWRTKN